MNTLISHMHTLISEDVFLSRAVPLLGILFSVIMITWFVFFVLDQNHNIPDEYFDFIGEVDVKWGKIVRVKYRCPTCNAVVSARTIRKHMPCRKCGCELFRLKEE